MTTPCRLVLALHNHQPVGNFDGVFEAAYQDSYRAFLDVLKDYPQVRISLHTSGSLLEWIEKHHPEYIDMLGDFVERGQIEVVGGPYYEPILAAIPRRDRIGQIQAYSEHLERLFGQKIRGMWVPERVWEQSFAGDVTQAGIEYTIVDDFHFRGAGLPADELHGYYLTEDEGRLLKMFPGSERLRYTIPFQDPQATIDHLRGIAESHPYPVVCFGDDGEKFGTWPGTKLHVYEQGWLRRFLDALVENSDWLRLVTLAEAVDQVPPLGRVYLPDSSYREMTEWALPTQQQQRYQEIVHQHEHDPEWQQLKPFVRGGFWRNFLVKYPESNEMYCRRREISSRIEQFASSNLSLGQRAILEEAKDDLYHGQCNCPYWHGAFGGLYLPHLRNAIYRHLIEADTLLERVAGREGKWVHVDAYDQNLDARKEVKLASDRLALYLSPARGGHLYELDVRSISTNLLATLNRRPEAYHDKVRHAAEHQNDDQSSTKSIHDLVHFKQPDLDKKLQYDPSPRKSLVDHFITDGASAEQFELGQAEAGDFVTGVYEALLRRSEKRVEVVLTRNGHVGETPIKLSKTVSLNCDAGNSVEIQYRLEQLPPGETFNLGVEFNFAAMPAGAGDRYFYGGDGSQLGQLQTRLELTQSIRIGLVDEWLGIDASLDFSKPADLWTFPIQTVSQSEGGFELVHQSVTVVPRWHVTADERGTWSVQIRMDLDTSIAHARRLADAGQHFSTVSGAREGAG